MASRSLSSPSAPEGSKASRSRFTRYRLPVLACAAAAVVAVVVPSGIGGASPSNHLSLRQVESRISALNNRADRITEAYDSATTALHSLQRQERITNAELAHDRSLLAQVQRRVAAGISAAYRTGGLDPTLSLVSSGSPQTFIEQSSSLDEVARYDANQVALADAAQRQVAAAEVVHNAQVAQQKATLARISNARGQIENLLHQQQQLLGRLKASQREELARQQNSVAQHETSLRHSYHPPSYSGPASGRAAIAVRYAYAQLGKPYQWGGSGPGSFDCSGLTMRAWGAAGVALPHSAAGQQAMLPHVSVSALEPGDLVFYGDPAYHTAIYIGGGRIIQAPHTGTVVQISSLADMPPTNAGRP
ncbi:MAG TPA: NlpC/P60 family protein [Mycobacteriales bacterium]|nr:NlpC/P60 family protein [Mycobacteriales bacterium]